VEVKARRAVRIKTRARNMRTRVRQGRQQLVRISRTATLGGLFLSFLKIGTVGFGGGLAVIAQIRTLTVFKRGWLTDNEFAEAFALAQSLPGTSAGNTATYIGLKLRGWRGASVAMAGFILPSMLMMILMAILYRHLRYLPDSDRLFHGLNAAVVALIVITAWRIGRNTLNKSWQWIIAVLSFLIVGFFGATVVEVVLTAGVVGIFIDSFAEKQLQKLRLYRGLTSRRRKRIAARLIRARRSRTTPNVFVGGYLMRALADDRVEKAALAAKSPGEDCGSEPQELDQPGLDEVKPPRKLGSLAFIGLPLALLAKLGLLFMLATIFLRIGAITFGGGYVMIPLIEAEVVNNNHWLTHQEFADATALGQITPGPVLISATFIGYRVAGTLGALVATVSIFLPSFLMTIAAGSYLRRFRSNEIVQSFLRGVAPAVVGLLAAAALSIGRSGIHTWAGLIIAIAAAIVLVRFRPNAFWVILGAGVARFLLGLVLK